ncbi:hypothetical protein KZX46_21760 (plasmid) [Polymorphobacter sp. PAMC 29334]|uniref:hypothetical protein n=1 Tax=Polymorphobacter sp. PAMC 29334 TaxID=2862331 RepID=UPI001C7995CB|nr:hypothetical protein [Polymorphobacter sp. PAMC 29334]QYE37261.1 hypothetical protein KZX46_21760 [Polymorphobacter sp. PAMC 29334]
MGRYQHLREIAILPCLPAGLSVEDQYLTKTAPSFDLQFAEPNAALAATLSFINISKKRFIDLVIERRGINLRSSKPQGSGTGPWRYRGEYAAAWRSLIVPHDPKRPQLLTDDQLVEVMENASYGGVLAIAGYVDTDFCLPREMPAVTVTGRFQVGIIAYIWGSGHTVTFDGSLTVDMTSGQIGDAPGCAYDEGCDFVVDYFRFRTLSRATLVRGERFRAEPRSAMALAA